MTDPRESDLNVLQMQQITTVNVECVADMFIKKHSKSCLIQLCILSEIYCLCLIIIETDALVYLIPRLLYEDKVLLNKIKRVDVEEKIKRLQETLRRLIN